MMSAITDGIALTLIASAHALLPINQVQYLQMILCHMATIV